MGLSTALNTAQTALSTNSALTALVSRNIAGVNDPGYSRKTGEVSTTDVGTTVTTRRSADSAVLAALLTATSRSAADQAVSDGLDQIEATVNLTSTKTSSTSTTQDTSPSTLLATLGTALQSYANSPSDTASGQAVVTAAKALAGNLNTATSTVQGIRAQADASMATAVASINTLLGQFKTLNDTVTSGTVTGQDVSDAMDSRDSILKQLSAQIGVTTLSTANNGLSLYTDSGAVLFQGTARTVSFTPTTTFTAGTVGAAVVVDGVPVTGASATMPITSGALAGLATLRDTTTVAYQNQLDQVAQGLVSAFAEKDQTGGTAPTIPGLFTATGASATATTAPAGLAGTLTVNANVDPSQGGTLTRLRDGGIGSPGTSAYVANTSGAASYATHLQALVTSLNATRSFDASSGGTASGTLASYASSSVSWLEATRKTATASASASSASVTATTSSLSNATGVNLDDELSKMTDLEHSYSASAQLMSTVKAMFDSLLSAMQ